jgi:hypothetical protein
LKKISNNVITLTQPQQFSMEKIVKWNASHEATTKSKHFSKSAKHFFFGMFLSRFFSPNSINFTARDSFRL